MSIVVRAFARADRDQVTALINAHAAAVVPNISVSVSALLSQLEREPGEFLVDPWVRERVTLVALQRSRVVAAAHLLRYSDDDRVSDHFRGAAEIRWLVCWPAAPYWPDSVKAGEALVEACVGQLARWRPTVAYGGGALPAPGVYGVPEQWPHVRDLYLGAGFTSQGHAEVVALARIQDLLCLPGKAALELQSGRTLGINGTRLSATLDGEVVGYTEVDTNLDTASRTSLVGDWADIGNLYVVPARRRQGIGSWLIGQAAKWLDLGGVTRLLSYADPDDDVALTFHEFVGFTALTRTETEFALRPTDAAR